MEWLQFREPVNTWTHLVWMLLAIPGALLLWQRGRGDLPKQISFLIFGIGLIVCFGASALYHGLDLPHDRLGPFITLDHIGIYVLIAATGTGMGFTILRGAWKWSLLIGIWAAAAIGITGRLVPMEWPRWINPCLYLLMGWGMVTYYPKLVQAVGHRGVRWIGLGGLFYTLGALCYILKWPVLWPGVLGWHEMLHVFDMAGSLTHFGFVLTYVARFERIVAVPELVPVPMLVAEQA
jgi:hemolysin III